MSNSKGQSNIRSMPYNGKSSSVLPPKIPLQGISQPYGDYVPNSLNISSKPFHNHGENSNHHQRTSSESFLMDEQPSWLDDLLDEPETPVRKGHRRSTSDSFAYLDMNDIGNTSLMARVDRRFENVRTPFLPWGSQHIDGSGDTRHGSVYQEPHLFGKTKSNNPWDAPPLGLVTPGRVNSSRLDVISVPNVGPHNTSQYVDKKSPSLAGKNDTVESALDDPKNSDDKRGSSDLNSSALEADTRRAKQYVNLR